MYAFIDRPIGALCKSGHFLLWAMRAWSYAVERRMCPPHALAPTFSHVGLLRALPDFHMAMALFNRDGLTPMALAPVQHAHVVEDEAVLLALWRDAALNQQERGRKTLELLVETDGVQPIETAMMAMVTRMNTAGFSPASVSTGAAEEAG